MPPDHSSASRALLVHSQHARPPAQTSPAHTSRGDSRLDAVATSTEVQQGISVNPMQQGRPGDAPPFERRRKPGAWPPSQCGDSTPWLRRPRVPSGMRAWDCGSSGAMARAAGGGGRRVQEPHQGHGCNTKRPCLEADTCFEVEASKCMSGHRRYGQAGGALGRAHLRGTSSGRGCSGSTQRGTPGCPAWRPIARSRCDGIPCPPVRHAALTCRPPPA